ncbi:MAG TPA: copper amine oxidase N-terminal domain-containing protein [Bacilli bacterium]
MIKTWASGILAVILMFSIVQPALAKTDAYRISLDGEYLVSDQAPINKNGSIMVPLRLIFESLHAAVTYSPADKKITGKKGNLTIELQVGAKTAYKNRQPIALAQPPVIINNRVYVPIRFIGEALGARVNWNSASRTVEIKTRELSETTELPVKNDAGEPIYLQHKGNMRLNWLFEDD